MAMDVRFLQARKDFHASLLKTTLTINDKNVPSNADSSNRSSIAIARGIAEILKAENDLITDTKELIYG